MRIIAGKWRGRRLAAPPGEGTRPMLDRAKVVVFDWLGSRLGEPGSLPPIAVLDLFAGAGTLGLECLSRGASWACFVEKAAPAWRALTRNVTDLAAQDECRIVRADALTARLPAPPEDRRYSLVFLDPPYRMTQRPSAGDPVVQRIIELGNDPCVADDALLLFRQDLHAEPLPPLPNWECLERREIGTMAITFFLKNPSL
jgi:16S rRNA (guanine966-N2)-methyltransferase